MTSKTDKAAVLEYLSRKSRNVDLVPLRNGLWVPPLEERCPMCANVQWSTRTGSHLRSIEHIAAKYGMTKQYLLYAVDLYEKDPKRLREHRFGWKSLLWNVEKQVLTSNGDFEWLPGKTTFAACDSCGEDLPQDHCSCGLYFFWEPQPAIGYYHGQGYQVTVKALLGGTVIEAELGCRAQAAKIKALHRLDKDGLLYDLEAVAALYNVPIIDGVQEYKDEQDSEDDD